MSKTEDMPNTASKFGSLFSSSRMPLIIGLGVVVVVLLIAAVWLIVRAVGDDAPDTPTISFSASPFETQTPQPTITITPQA